MTAFTVLDPDRAYEVQSLVRMMDEILQRAVAAYEQSGVPVPDRRYWTLGPAVVDCEQMVLSFSQAFVGPPGDEASIPQNCNSPRSAAMDLQVARCVPTVGPRGRAPDAAAIQASSEQLAVDAYLLLDIAANLETWDSLGTPGLGVIATVDVAAPTGGYQSVTLHLTSAIP